MLKQIASVALVASLVSPMASAEKLDFSPWKECGIGAMIFEDEGNLAAISNIIWDLGTTAVSSKVISEDTCAGSKAKTAMFIQQSYNNIIEETAKGNGEHVTAMLDLLEVNPAARQDVMNGVRADMADAVNQAGYANATTSEKAEMYYDSLIANSAA